METEKNSKFKKIFAITYSTALVAFTTYAALDTFVIPKAYTVVAQEDSVTEEMTTGAYQETQVEQTTPGGRGQGRKGGRGGRGSGDSAAGGFSGRGGRGSGDSGAAQSVTGQQEATVPVSDARTVTAQEQQAAADAVVTADSYEDENIKINITTYETNDTSVYVADVTLSSAEYLQTAFAQNTFGRNIKAETSEIAEAHDAILAVNGDFYGSRNAGYVIRDGVLYRDTSAGNEGLALMKDGSFTFYNEGEVSAQQLLDDGAKETWSFGPALLADGEIQVSQTEEVGRAKASNPRTAIGIIDDLHYVLVVSDGRTNESEGLSLYELASFLQSIGVKDAYNLDGGGSSTMVFQGTLVNNPTTGGNSIDERSVSDIVYIGY